MLPHGRHEPPPFPAAPTAGHPHAQALPAGSYTLWHLPPPSPPLSRPLPLPRPAPQAYLTFERGVRGPHLVVVPLSVLPNWIQEFKRFCPDLRVVRMHVNDEGEPLAID